MIVVADAGPLRYLVLISQVHVLGNLFDRVLVPATVEKELTHKNTPEAVGRWMKNRPHWLETLEAMSVTTRPALDSLDEGERQAIVAAQRLHIPLLLMDEVEGRAAAASLGLAVLGTIGILERAAKLQLLDFASAFKDLQQTNFHMSGDLRRMISLRHKLD